MARYLRDFQVQNVSISRETLVHLHTVITERMQGLDDAVVAMTIRFDEKGYRIFSVEDLLRYFELGNKIERVVFSADTRQSATTSRNLGAYIDLRLDENDPKCFLTVSSDDEDWVIASFSAIENVLKKCKNHNGFIRTPWTQFVLQLLGIGFSFLCGMWVAKKIAPILDIESPFAVSLFFVVIVFASIWSQLVQRALAVINQYFPSIKFFRPKKDRLHWLMQAVVGSIVFACFVYFLDKAWTLLTMIVASIVRQGG